MRVCEMIKADKAFCRAIHPLILQLLVTDNQQVRYIPYSTCGNNMQKVIHTEIRKDFINPADIRPQLNNQEIKNIDVRKEKRHNNQQESVSKI
jgi:tripartite-type tricarboxylate transporter receptor subunit TctC